MKTVTRSLLAAVLCLATGLQAVDPAPVAAATPEAAPPTDTPGAEQAAQLMRKHFADKIPDLTLTNDHGQPVRFVTDLVKDHAVVISFFYTNCRGTCPGTNALLAGMRETLAKDFGKSVRLISISVEPEVDDVPTIHEYAGFFRKPSAHPDMPDWHFLTGKPEDIKKLRRALGYYEVDPKIDADPTQHAAMLILGNQATGRWAMMPIGIGPDRMAGKVRLIAGWTSAQRYADVYAHLEKNRKAEAASEKPKTTAAVIQP
ncbi:MAG: SCO family protein [Prosthecobacter sp.]|uniref:SCO family protein n=1 Tax=Prosthecobacter sp. TaxID=1965333 RepID=UPI0038FDF00B